MHDLPWAAASALLALLLAAFALDLGSAQLDVPWTYSGDSLQNQMFVKTMLDHGWFQTNPDLGFPHGQDLRDFAVASGDTLHMLLMRMIGFVTDDSAVVMNLFFLLTFPLTAVLAFVVLRALGLGQVAALASALLFAFLPYHLLRGEYHLFLASYYAVPLGCWLVLEALAGRPFGSRRRLILIAVACVVVGSAQVYYAAFTLLLLAAAAILGALWRRDRGELVRGAAVAGMLVVVVVANHVPNIVHRLDAGTNDAIVRTVSESELYGLRLAQLVLPVAGHRLDAFDDLQARYSGPDQVQEAAAQAIGLVPVAGLAFACVAALGGAFRRREPDLPARAGVAALVAMLVGTAGGLSILFALVSPEVRSWGRISVFLGFFGLVGAGWLLDRFERSRGRAAAAILAAALLTLGFLDQTPAGVAPDHEAVAAEYSNDGDLVHAVERRLPAGAAVFELPYEPFPEPQPGFPVPRFGPYDIARGYIHSSDLRWSYGAVKGRNLDWQAAMLDLPPRELALAAAASGFAGLWVDGAGYADDGERIVARLAAATGRQPMRSRDGRLSFFDIRGLRPPDAGERRAAALAPLAVSFDDGFSAIRHDARSRWRYAASEAAIHLHNPARRARTAYAAMTLAPAAENAEVAIEWPGGDSEQIRARTPGTEVRRRVRVAAGGTVAIVIRTRGGAGRALPEVPRLWYLRVIDPLMVDEVLLDGEPQAREPAAAGHLSPFSER